MKNEIKAIVDKVMGELGFGDCSVIEIKINGNGETEYSVEDTKKCCCEEHSAKKRNEIKTAISVYIAEVFIEFMVEIYSIIKKDGEDGIDALNELFEELSEVAKDNFKLQVISK